MNEAIKLYKQPPHVTYKYLLDKGEDLTIGEVVYLLNKEVHVGKIAKATNMKIQEVRAIGERADRYVKNHKKGAMEMGKFTLTQAEYNDHKAQGKTDSEIAKANGVTSAGLKYHKDKWKRANKAKGGEVLREKSLKLKTEPSEEHVQVVNQLKEKLDYSERVSEGVKRNHENLKKQYNSVVAEYEKQQETIGRLETRVLELEEEVNKHRVHAKNVEKTVSGVTYEQLEREQQLMIDADFRKNQAEMYKNENVRLNETLSEVRKELEKSKGENVLFRAVIKEVIC